MGKPCEVAISIFFPKIWIGDDLGRGGGGVWSDEYKVCQGGGDRLRQPKLWQVDRRIARSERFPMRLGFLRKSLERKDRYLPLSTAPQRKLACLASAASRPWGHPRWAAGLDSTFSALLNPIASINDYHSRFK
jgi:hypothetical protein